MSVAELVEQAHESARDKGFWESENVGEKLALIATEVAELEEACAPEGRLEELADIVIRVFDLCGYLGVELPEDCLTAPRGYYLMLQPFCLRAYRYTAQSTQAHRKQDAERVRNLLIDLVELCAIFTADRYGDSELEWAIEEKMERNQARPQLHGRLY